MAVLLGCVLEFSRGCKLNRGCVLSLHMRNGCNRVAREIIVDLS